MLTVRDTAAAPSPPTILLPESTPGVSVGMIVVKVYAFGGLTFVMGIIVCGFGWWFWNVVIKRQARDFPPDLENYESSSALTPGPLLNGNLTPAPTKSSRGRKSSLSTNHSPKGKRVSWASSTATLDVDGNASIKSVADAEGKEFDDERMISPRPPTPGPTSPTSSFPFSPTISGPTTPSNLPLSPAPRVHTQIPRTLTSIEPRAPRGQMMIATTTPDVCESWSKPTQLQCSFSDSISPLDTSTHP